MTCHAPPQAEEGGAARQRRTTRGLVGGASPDLGAARRRSTRREAGDGVVLLGMEGDMGAREGAAHLTSGGAEVGATPTEGRRPRLAGRERSGAGRGHVGRGVDPRHGGHAAWGTSSEAVTRRRGKGFVRLGCRRGGAALWCGRRELTAEEAERHERETERRREEDGLDSGQYEGVELGIVGRATTAG